MSDSRKRVADIAFLVALMLYILAGVNSTPPHGDEYMFTAMASPPSTELASPHG